MGSHAYASEGFLYPVLAFLSLVLGGGRWEEAIHQNHRIEVDSMCSSGSGDLRIAARFFARNTPGHETKSATLT